ncbi:hypothetical protein CDN99_08805 [Roseateles aquatilis]|uniref:Uncharacterized protein n=1 Tax=Roseateles aquatilis TaxID=431061 RepID=A0A246JG85_9BURK|nr:hypothetical protein [Roseateles aquatilis]OWQ91267.1 hypothetical protein CDN99_08805 [Roseateles aquatilis]
MFHISMPEPRTMMNSKVPPGCWVDQHDWSDWPLGDHACSPGEWPFNLEAPRHSREFAGILRWFLKKHPSLHEPDLGDYLALAEKCAEGRTITAQVDFNPETAVYQLCLTIYECRVDGQLGSKEMDRFWDLERDKPEFEALRHHVWVTHQQRPFPGLART